MSDLLKINVNDHTEKKNGLTYLSWAWAWAEVLKVDPAATWEAVEFNGFPASFSPDRSAMVKVIVTIGGQSKSCWLPVMNHRNQAIKEPDAFAINTAIVRCMTKAIAMFGLGLYIYAGEDLPEGEDPMEILADKATALFEAGDVDGAVKLVNSVTDAEEGLKIWAIIPAELKKACKALPAERQAIIEKAYSNIVDHFAADDVAGAFEEYSGFKDSKEKAALWAKLGKKEKTAISDFGRSLK